MKTSFPQEEPFPGQPIAELAGDRRLLIENHRGVYSYGTECICVQVRFGQLHIRGRGLCLCYMTRERLLIQGNIDEIRMVRRGIC